MRLTDADAVPIIGISDYSVMLQKTLDAQPTIDLWHYPSRKEYPPEELYVLCKLLDGTYEVGKYCPSKYKEYQEYEPPWDFGDYLEDYIKCWQYIVPPKKEACTGQELQ